MSLSQNTPGSNPAKSLVVYEVFVQSFRDSNDDGIGDLKGLISKLDYIEDLGATAIWITPVHPSPSYHKYDVTDYYGIHPDFGTMEDMEALIAEAHKRNMLIILDLVINHTSSLHPWFIEASSSEANPYHDYYVWKNYAEVQDEINKKEVTLDSDNITQWHEHGKITDRYYGFFWKGMPDLNFDNPKVREEILDIAKFWMAKGIDGFRMDAAKHIFPDDQLDKTRDFWIEFTPKLKEIKSEVIVIGEVWADPETVASLSPGLPVLFNFELAKAIPELINSGDTKKFREAYHKIVKAYGTVPVPPFDATILSNHDMNRISSSLDGNIEKSKLAASILLSLPGIPFIYYGEELGTPGVKPDEHLREPFLWGDANFTRNPWIQPIYSTADKMASLITQQADTSSIYHHYKKWIALRHRFPEIAEAMFDIGFPDNTPEGLLMFFFSDDFVVMHNVTGNRIEHSWNKFLDRNWDVIIGELTTADKHCTLHPYSSVILRRNSDKIPPKKFRRP